MRTRCIFGEALRIRVSKFKRHSPESHSGRMVRSAVFTMSMIARLMVRSTPTQASLFISSLTKVLHDNYLCLNLTSCKLKKSEATLKRKIRKQRQLLSESGFVLCIAPPSLFRDRRIKMKKSSSNHQHFYGVAYAPGPPFAYLVS